MTDPRLKLVSDSTTTAGLQVTAVVPSQTGGGGGGGGGKGMDPLTEERIKRSEAETRVEIVRLEGKIDQLINAVTELKSDTNSNKWQLIAFGVGIATLLIGIWAFQSQLLGLATSLPTPSP
jgi:hypothetical protein